MALTIRKGFNVPCIKCGDAGFISISLNDIEGKSAIVCGSCDESFGIDDVMKILEQWKVAIEWIKTAPPLRPTEDSIFCGPCHSFHPIPISEEEWKALRCQRPWIEWQHG